jgi:hypothetical protein
LTLVRKKNKKSPQKIEEEKISYKSLGNTFPAAADFPAGAAAALPAGAAAALLGGGPAAPPVG